MDEKLSTQKNGRMFKIVSTYILYLHFGRQSLLLIAWEVVSMIYFEINVSVK